MDQAASLVQRTKKGYLIKKILQLDIEHHPFLPKCDAFTSFFQDPRIDGSPQNPDSVPKIARCASTMYGACLLI